MAGTDGVVSSWLLVDTLVTPPSIVADGHRFRDWVPLSRAGRALGAGAAALAAVAVHEASTANPDDAPVVVSAGTCTAVAVAVRCAFGVVHGVQLWVGPIGQDPPPRRAVAAWDWDSGTELAHHGPGLEELVFGRDPQQVRVVRTPPEIFGRVVRFDGRMEYIAVVSGADPSGRWQGELVVCGDDDVVRTFQLVVGVHDEDRHTGAAGTARVTRALVHEITDTAPPRPDPDLAITRIASRSDDAGVAFVELSLGLVYEWVSPPPPPLQRWSTELPRVHPDDLRRYRAACATVFAGERDDPAQEFDLRLRFDGADWVGVRVELSRLGPEPVRGMIRVWPLDD